MGRTSIARGAIVFALASACLGASAQAAFAQSAPFSTESTAEESPPPAPAVPTDPGGFRKIRLGMSMDAVKEALKQDRLFSYRGDPDVSFIPVKEQRLIECGGNLYIDRAYFQFHDDRLLVMILMLDPAEVSYYETLEALRKSYGDPAILDPTHVVWETGALRLSLERPVTVKYVDAETYATLRGASSAGDDFEGLSRQRFLDQL